jgi:hypothetical protein
MTMRAMTSLLCCAALLCPELARASESYPTIVAQTYVLPSEPECTLCHSTIEGGPDTITTAFGKNIEARGARGKIPASLRPALIEAANERQDSDGDGVTDLQELRDGTDPNLEGDAIQGGGGAGGEIEFGTLDDLPPLPAHGCAFGSRLPGSGPTSLLCAGALLALLRRRRKTPARGAP